MIDIFDAALPPIKLAISAIRRASWSLATHRLTLPFLFLIVCMATLWALSRIMEASRRSLLSGSVCEGQTGPRSSIVSVRAYPVPHIRLVSSSSDELTVVVEVTSPATLPTWAGDDDAGRVLLEDVRSGVVDTVMLGGAIWHALPHTTMGGCLTLTSLTITSFPVPGAVTGSFSAGWSDGLGGSALIIAFRHDSD